MFSSAFYSGDAIARFYLFGTLEDSTEVPIAPEDLGIGYWHFRKHFINGLARDNYEAIKMLVELYQNMQGRRLVSLRLEDYPLILSRDGVRPAPPKVLKNLRLEHWETK